MTKRRASARGAPGSAAGAPTRSTAGDAAELERFFARELDAIVADGDAPDQVSALLDALEAGVVRAAWPPAAQGRPWRAAHWVKRGILAAFRLGRLAPMPNLGGQQAFDKDTLPLRALSIESGVRLVPGGSSIRRGAFVARGVTVMPPAYINVGAHVDSGAMVDSHALVGSCAQVGRSVHLSAGAQVGGVLEPVNAVPVVVEDNAFLGALSGVFEGVRVSEGAVLAAGVILTRSTPIADLVHDCWIRPDESGVLEVPAGAIVVPGARPARGAFAAGAGISLQTPVIVRYRQPGADPVIVLEEALRQ